MEHKAAQDEDDVSSSPSLMSHYNISWPAADGCTHYKYMSMTFEK